MDRPLPSRQVGVARTDETLLEVIQLRLQIITIGLRERKEGGGRTKGRHNTAEGREGESGRW